MGTNKTTVKKLPLRHFRGKGIHSPFVYGLVREVFMGRRRPEAGDTLYEAIAEAGADSATATEIQNLYNHCGYKTFAIAREGKEDGGAEFVIVPAAETTAYTREIIEKCARERKTAVILLNEREDKIEICRGYAAPGGCPGGDCLSVGCPGGDCLSVGCPGGGCPSVDRGAYFVFFYDRRYPAQHFKL